MKKLLFGVLAASLLAAPAGAAELGGTLKKIKDSGTITLGYREQSNPFSFLDEAKKPVGYSLDLCARVVDTVKTQLGLSELKVNYVPLTAENRFDAVANGTVDVLCGNSTNTLSRQKQVSFSAMTFVTGGQLPGPDRRTRHQRRGLRRQEHRRRLRHQHRNRAGGRNQQAQDRHQDRHLQGSSGRSGGAGGRKGRGLCRRSGGSHRSRTERQGPHAIDAGGPVVHL